MKFNRKALCIIAYAFLSLFIAYQSLTIYFTHPHQVRGALIIHTHPFQKSEKEHTHSLFEFQLMELSTVHLLLIFFGGVLLSILLPLIKYRIPSLSFSFSNGIRHVFHLRGPPAVSVIHL